MNSRRCLKLMCMLYIFILRSPSPVLARECYTETIIARQNNNQCPPGYEGCHSDEGVSVCQICQDRFYQSDWNYGDKLCLAKEVCDGSNMSIDEQGSSTENSNCKCLPGYHFPNGISLVCLNDMCPPGQGQSEAGDGRCVACAPGTYSDIYDRVQPCLNAIACRKRMQCTLAESTPISNTKCSRPVTDLSQCAIHHPHNVTATTRSDNSMQTTSISSTEQSDVNPNYLGIGIVVGVGFGICVLVIIIILAILLVVKLCCRRRIVDSGYKNPNIPLDKSPDVVNTSCSVDELYVDIDPAEPSHNEDEDKSQPLEGQEVTHKQLVALSKKLGHDWIVLSNVLGYPQQYEKDIFSHNNANRPDISALNMLTKWKEDNDGNATVEKLMDGLKDAQIMESIYLPIFQNNFEQTVPKVVDC